MVNDWQCETDSGIREYGRGHTEHQLGDALHAALRTGRTTVIAARSDGSANVDQFNALREL